MNEPNLEGLKVMVRALLDHEEHAPRTDEEVEAIVQSVAPLAQGDEETLERLRRYIEEQVVITMVEPSTLDDSHTPWLADRRADFDWLFWERYRRHLAEQSGLPRSVIDRIDETTDRILDHLKDPATTGAWDRRGLVVGQVQSGKTANYLGLIAKAIDVGYRVIVVLAGAGNDLRAQTQIRLEEGIIGWDTSGRKVDIRNPMARKVGVGRLSSDVRFVINPATTRDTDGDFRASQASVMKAIGNDPMVLVIKKNKSVLTNVIKALTSVSADLGPGDRRIIRGHPLLLIDDEADHYSVNTAVNDPEVDPTAINGLVRQMLACFDQSAYVGYTATAFANIFIALDDSADDEFGATLFPRDFMISVKPPSNYVGARRVFGLDDPSVEEQTRPLPIVRSTDDAEDWLPSKHKKSAVPGDFLPDSLEQAVDSFLLSIAARAARGQEDAHNSMLVHVTRFNDVQARVTEQLDGRIRQMRSRLRHGDDGRTLRRLRELWETDHVPTTRAMEELTEFGQLRPLSWEEIEPKVRPAVESVELRTINGLAKEVLDYTDRSSGLNVIAIGGDKLSRGLTLDGLTVSYYLRTSRAYDTLLQMGRWFGYRQGYADLCRLYTTRQLEGWYRDITVANAELLHDLDRMADAGATPREFGLRVRTHPDGLMVSSPNKVREAQKITISFANQTREQVAYARDPQVKSRCLEAMGKLLSEISDHRDADDDSTRVIFDGVPGSHVVEFLRAYPTNAEARLTRTDLMADYVEDRLPLGELDSWRVVVFSPEQGKRRSLEVGGINISFMERSSDKRTTVGEATEETTDHDQFRIKRLLGTQELAEGLTDEEKGRARQLLEAGEARSVGDAYRAQRNQGVLFLALLDPSKANGNTHRESDAGPDAVPYVGLTLVFPGTSRPDAGRQYLIGEVYRQMQLGWEDDE